MSMKKKSVFFAITILFAILFFSACKTADRTIYDTINGTKNNSMDHYDFSLKNTLAIFLLNNENGKYFCIPIQYMGDFQINNFEFADGRILIGNHEIKLNRDEIKINVYLNEAAELDGNSDIGFNLIYSEENGSVFLTKMAEALKKHERDDKLYHYYIFIEKYLNDDDIRKIANEYKKGNLNSSFGIEYNLTIDDELQTGSGLLDNFELYDGAAIDPVWLPPNLNFFKTMYL